MDLNRNNKHSSGILMAVGAYFLWGILPVYWKLLQSVDPLEILAHRITWCLVFLVVILFITRRIRQAINEIKLITKNPVKILAVTAAAFILTLNWYTYIWAVNSDLVIQASLGYYINPLISVLLGVIVLKEKLNKWQKIACILAFIGVSLLTVNYGAIPWAALILAFTFGLYGLIKKVINIEPLTCLVMESAVMAIFSLMYLHFLHSHDQGTMGFGEPGISLLFIGAGIVTSIPLILFSKAVNHLPLSLMGFLQYLNPTISLLLGIFLFHETFSVIHFIAFAIIWVGLIIFSLSNGKETYASISSRAADRS